MKSSLQIKYEKEIVPVLMKKFNYTSVMEVPKIEKIVINMTAGKEVSNSKAIEEVQNELMFITGQKPLTVIAKKSNASFKLREGMPMGGKVTMRRERMWTFLNELINVSKKYGFNSYGEIFKKSSTEILGVFTRNPWCASDEKEAR